MNSPSQQNLSKLQQKLKSLSLQVSAYHEQLDRLRQSTSDKEDALFTLTNAVAEKTKEIAVLDNTYREKHLAWLDILVGHQTKVDILRDRISRLEREESEINTRIGNKLSVLAKENNTTFLTLT